MKTLTERTSRALRAKIEDGTFALGEKLPTLHLLAAEFGVSRTVVREAVAALQSDGLLQSRHGVGIFVRAAPPPPAPASDGSAALQAFARAPVSFMDLLELRVAFEVHAAGLAATRRSWGQESRIWEAERAFEARVENEDELDRLDFEFHRAIADATNNQAFIEFFVLMSPGMMPRPAFSRALNPSLVTGSYIRQTIVEHRAICEAIGQADPQQAREAMRSHLSRSHQRYRGFSDSGLSPLSNVARN